MGLITTSSPHVINTTDAALRRQRVSDQALPSEMFPVTDSGMFVTGHKLLLS